MEPMVGKNSKWNSVVRFENLSLVEKNQGIVVKRAKKNMF
jgi:hypothetical protein